MIRVATRKDIPACITLGIEFANLSKPIHRFEVDENRIREFTNEVIDNSLAVVLVLEEEGVIQGLIMGVINEIYFSKDIALQELAWYVRKGFKGIGMLEAFEAQGIKQGCNKVIVGNKPAYYDLSRYYERRGYLLLEQQYSKTIRI